MEGLFALIIVLVVGLIAAGPVAVILAIVLFNKIGNLERRVNRIEFKDYEAPVPPQPMTPPFERRPVQEAAQVPSHEPMPSAEQQPPTIKTGVAASSVSSPPIPPSEPLKPPTEMDFTKIFKKPQAKEGNMEVKIGVTVALIVGVITVIIGVGFFLKYVYENIEIPPEMWVGVIAVGGIVALAIGEVLRRRDYEIVAKGITALGFALLYAAVFSAYKVFDLIDTWTAYGGAIGVTAAAMIYAVWLDEMLIAFLSLLGGYLSPIIITTDRNLPIHLFSYVTVLSLGAMAAAVFRRWRAINWMAFLGTYILYSLWFDKFYESDQMKVALFWLGVFAGVYLLLPVMHSLLHKVIAHGEDVALIAANNVIVFFYLWRILYADFRQEMALAVAGVGAVHLIVMVIARWRCKEDVSLQSVLGVAGTAYITAAIGLYFTRLQPALIGWAIEAVVLAFMTIRYRSLWSQAASIIVAGIATAGLFYQLPLHESEQFRVFLNESFSTWLFVALAILVCHLLWRLMRSKDDEEAALMTQIYYLWGWLLMAAGAALEWHDHCWLHFEYVHVDETYFFMGMMIIASILTLGLFVRPVCPAGQFVQIAGFIAAVSGAVFTCVALGNVYYHAFTIFANWPFVVASIYGLVLLASAWFVSRAKNYKDQFTIALPSLLVLTGLLLFWGLLSVEVYQFWYCAHAYGGAGSNWEFLAQMYMSVAWAIYAAVLMIIGFACRTQGIRYLSLAIFAVLLGKIFIIDTATLRTEYRIAAFLTTGLVLVGISFLYQFLKKKGFFDAIENKAIENNNAERGAS